MNLGIMANLRKPRAHETLCAFVEWLSQKQIGSVVTPEVHRFIGKNIAGLRPVPPDRLASESDVLIVMGGDGTMLAAARQLGPMQKPLLGINLGSLGFLADVALDDLYTQMEAVIAGRYTLENRMTLSVSVSSDSGNLVYPALNDVVVARGGIPRMIQIRVMVDGSYFTTYFTDGIIVATPTGSTAYSLGAGGPIVVPSLESIILTPICPHTLTARPTVIPQDSRILLQLESEDREAFFSVDGQVMKPIDCRTRIEVRRGDWDVQLIKFEGHNFFDVLRTKLQWGTFRYKLSDDSPSESPDRK
ncbi:MAG TPA: NAD(+)/NADH kinase [bacterium]|nr:NAD(+)/NADH kinase [bacterium]